MTKKEQEAYQKGIDDAKFGLSYLNPYWSKEELIAWAKGYKKGKANK
jgi:hypothetical protein